MIKPTATAKAYDAYHKWLGIGPDDQPPTHYRLLGLEPFESDGDVIANAADARIAYVRKFQNGRFLHISRRLLNEIRAARGCLLDDAKKVAYDRQLQRERSWRTPPAAPAAPPPVAPPPARSAGHRSPVTSTPAMISTPAPRTSARQRRAGALLITSTGWLLLFVASAVSMVCGMLAAAILYGVLFHLSDAREITLPLRHITVGVDPRERDENRTVIDD